MVHIIGDQGGPTADTLEGSDNPETIEGLLLNDILRGKGGQDELYGGDGDDTLEGGNDGDFCFGEDGDDEFLDISGHNTFDGGDGADLVNYDALSSGVTINNTHGFNGDTFVSIEALFTTFLADTVTFRYDLGGERPVGANQHIFVLHTADGNDTVTVKEAAGSLPSGYVEGAAIYAGTGKDVVTGGSLNDDIFGEAGNDTLTGNSGDDLLDGYDDNDRLLGGKGEDSLHDGYGTDRMTGGADGDVYFLSNDNVRDFIFVNSAKDSRGNSKDVVFTFDLKYDQIDLRKVDANTSKSGDQAFKIVSAFHNKAGEMVLKKTTPAPGLKDWTYSGDTNGDGHADITFTLFNPRTQNPDDDFLLL